MPRTSARRRFTAAKPYDATVDFSSPQFNPRRALKAVNLKPPHPDVPPLDNLSSYLACVTGHSTGPAAGVKSASEAKICASPSTSTGEQHSVADNAVRSAVGKASIQTAGTGSDLAVTKDGQPVQGGKADDSSLAPSGQRVKGKGFLRLNTTKVPSSSGSGDESADADIGDAGAGSGTADATGTARGNKTLGGGSDGVSALANASAEQAHADGIVKRSSVELFDKAGPASTAGGTGSGGRHRGGVVSKYRKTLEPFCMKGMAGIETCEYSIVKSLSSLAEFGFVNNALAMSVPFSHRSSHQQCTTSWSSIVLEYNVARNALPTFTCHHEHSSGTP